MFKFKRLFRQWSNSLLCLLSMVLVIILASCEQPVENIPANSGGSTPTDFRIGFQLNANPETLTKSLGLMEKQYPDVSIVWVPFDSGQAVNDAMASGSLDVGLVGSVPASVGIAQGLPYKVYFIQNIIGDNEALAVTPSSAINSIADLSGKTIAVPFGSTTHFSLLSALKQEGVATEAVQILDMQPQDMLTAWQYGDIDGGFVWHPVLSRMMDDDATIVTTARQLAEEGIITADVGVVNEAFAEQYPDFLASYVAALDSAVQLYRDDPITASEAISAEIALSPEESLAVMDDLIWLSAEEQASEKYLGTPNVPGGFSQVLKDSADFMVEQGEIPTSPDLDIYESALFNQVVADLNP
ncbi:MAG: ABC transporter substrate-binding protein [Cyanobacteria bacterium J06636_16]